MRARSVAGVDEVLVVEGLVAGGAARAAGAHFDLANVDPNLGGMLPADLDGPPPPSGSPNFFVEMDGSGKP